MRIPSAHQGDDFELRLFRRYGEWHRAVKQIRIEGRTMIGALNSDHCLAQIAIIKEVADKNLGAS